MCSASSPKRCAPGTREVAPGAVAPISIHCRSGSSLPIRGPMTGFHRFRSRRWPGSKTFWARSWKGGTIHPARVIGHSDMAPGRKVDPGPAFDWKRLAISGLSVWTDDSEKRSCRGGARPPVAPRGDRWSRFRSAAVEVGYAPESDDETGWRAVLTAFRTRFRTASRNFGERNAVEPDEADIAAMTSLARNFGAKSIDPGWAGT